MNFVRSRQLAALFLLCLSPSMALGQGASKPEARQHFDRGLALAKDKAYAEAIAEFNHAYEISPNFAVLFNLGQAYVAVDQPVYAVEALRRYLNDGGNQIPKVRRKQVEADIAEQGRRIATVVVRCALDGVPVRLDGVDLGKTPLSNAIWVKAGPHVLSASMPGYRPWEESVDLIGKFQKTVEIRLEPASPSATAPRAAAAPAAAPPATPASRPTAIATSRPAQTPPAPVASAPAARTTAVPAREPTPQTTPPQAVPAAAASTETSRRDASPATAPLAASPAPASTGTRKIAAYVVGGVGVASLVAGGIFGIRAISKRHDSDAECPGNQCSEQGVRLNNEAKTAAWVSDFTIGAGLVGVAVATYLLLRSPKPDAAAPGPLASRIRVSPEVGPGQAGLALGGSW
jgi:hypothetical protein